MEPVPSTCRRRGPCGGKPGDISQRRPHPAGLGGLSSRSPHLPRYSINVTGQRETEQPLCHGFHRGDRGDALPGCAGQGQVRGTAEASCLFPVLFPAALPLHSGSRELGEGLLPSPAQALPQTNACPGAFSICETGQAVDSIFFFFFLAHKPLIIYCIKKTPLASTTFVPVLSN